MKKHVLTLSMVALFTSVLFISCSFEKTTESTEQVGETSYYCPMKCEGDKTYTEQGSCPKCGMNLIVVE